MRRNTISNSNRTWFACLQCCFMMLISTISIGLLFGGAIINEISVPIPVASAFVVPSHSRFMNKHTFTFSSTSHNTHGSNSNHVLHALPSIITSTSSSLQFPTVDSSALTQYFLETLISYGVPAFFWIVIIAFAAKSFNASKKNTNRTASGPNGNLFGQSSSNVVSALYDDLYGDNQNTLSQSTSPFSMLFNRNSNNNNNIPKNIGVPKKQYLQITKLNDIYSSYNYSLTAATQSKAKAAAIYRSQAFDSAIQRAVDSSILELNNGQKSDLLLEEKEFLKKGGEIMDNIVSLQYMLTQLIINDEMDQMEVEVGEVDISDNSRSNIIDATIVNNNNNNNDNESTTNKDESSSSTEDGAITKKSNKNDNKKKVNNNKKEINKLVKTIERQNTDLLKLEMEFIRAVVEIMGPVSEQNIISLLHMNTIVLYII